MTHPQRLAGDPPGPAGFHRATPWPGVLPTARLLPGQWPDQIELLALRGWCRWDSAGSGPPADRACGTYAGRYSRGRPSPRHGSVCCVRAPSARRSSRPPVGRDRDRDRRQDSGETRMAPSDGGQIEVTSDETRVTPGRRQG